MRPALVALILFMCVAHATKRILPQTGTGNGITGHDETCRRCSQLVFVATTR